MADLQILIQQIHKSPFQVVLVLTGGGSQALANLLAVPGASNTLLEGLIPYSEKAVTAFLEFTPASYVSEETAMMLAEKAYARALILRENPATPLLGAACTRVSKMINCVGSFAGIFGPLTAGFMVAQTASWVLPFVVAAGFGVVCSAILFVVPVRPIIFETLVPAAAIEGS